MFYRQDRLWLKIVEVVGVFVLIVFIDLVTGGEIVSSIPGILLLFVLLAALRYGLNTGLLAFLLLGIYRLFYSWLSGEDVLLLFYETDSLIAFLWLLYVALFAGLFSTSYREKYESLQFHKEEIEDENEYLKETVDLLEETQRMLQTKVLESDHSLSRIYQVGIALDQDHPELIRSEALNVFREVFKAKQMAIYHVDRSQRALRLLIKHDEENQLRQTILVEETSSMYKRMFEGRTITIRNVEDHEDSPVLLAPLTFEGEIREVVLLEDIEFHSITAHQMQVLSLVLDWMSSRLQKAYKLQLEKEKPKMFSGTGVYKKQFFNELIEMEEKKAKEFGLPYLIGKIRLKSTVDVPIIEAEMMIRSHIREIDRLGYDAGKNELWFLFPGTEPAAREVVFPRIETVLRQKGVVYDA
ncbi:hypothetical protein IMZ31_05055 [Pontibacillus sp. ALD_SL1]|uniref:hypothetical protein n=1 Tax=Pontibacillus sp. ALD_SL1 TaxID=2777185 RepID=UPI001A97A7A3|nr:hypothetical protein [Pontibacillus sp. ALD_SL1]QST00941.1 hypothetical protein IMZ31_05055 [Pontibacillus sp. ALD_SL1]